MNRETLQRMLSLGESQSLEYKTGINPAAIGREICAFLNSGGGYLVIGIADNGDVLGVPAGQDIKELEKAITTGLVPKTLVSFEEQLLDSKPVWVIEVPFGQDIPFSYRNEIFIREGNRTRRADVETIKDMVMRRQVEPERWERRFSDANPERDLDQDEIRSTARQAVTIHRAGPAFDESRSPIEALERLGLMKYGRLTNGGDVLFAVHPAVRHPQVRVRAVFYTSDKSDETYRDHKNIEGPLVQMLEQTFAFIQRNTPSRSRFIPARLTREERSLYPPEAIREGLVNAFAHRDYADFSGGIAVHIYPNRLEIWNSGNLPEGISPDDLVKGHISVLRNPDIAHILYLRGLMEKLGRGCVMIRKACEEYGIRPPVWHADANTGVTLTFFSPEVITEVGMEVTTEVGTEVTTEVTTEVKAVLTALTGDMTRRDLQEKLGLKNAEHFRKHYLIPVLEGGFVEMTIPDKPQSRLQRYRLTRLGRHVLERPGSDPKDRVS